MQVLSRGYQEAGTWYLSWDLCECICLGISQVISFLKDYL